MTSYNMLLAPVMMLAKAVERGKYNPQSEWNLNPLLNKILLGVTKLEKFILNVGINLPIGGSQIVVAKKNNKN